MKSYSKLNETLTGRCKGRRKVANNTYAERRGDAIAIRLHGTDVVTFHADGRIVANTGGWKTLTTKDRLNEWLPGEVWQHRGKWTFRFNGQEYPYADGLTIHADGTVTGQAPQTEQEAERMLRKQIADYCRELVAALPLPMPSGGDCWYCGIREKNTGQPLGEVNGDKIHLQSHLEGKYFVPSLVWRALEFCGCQPKGGGCAWFAAAFDKQWNTDRKPVGRMVRKYLHRQFGLV